MVQDPLSVIGARLEARLNAQDIRLKSVEQSVREKVAANPPAAFTLLPDGTKQFGYAPTSANAVELLPETEIDAVADSGPGSAFSPEIQDAVKAQFITNAPVFKAVQETAKPQVTAETPAPEAVETAVAQAAEIAAATVVPAPLTSSAPVASEVAAPAPIATPAPVDTPVHTASAPAHTASAHVSVPTAASAVASVAANANVSANVSNTSSAGFVMLPDGTKQFGFAPTGPTVNIVPNKTPPVSAEFGAGATFRFKGVQAGPPMTVTRTGDGVVFAMVHDGEIMREMALMPNQLDLVTAAVG